MKHMFCNVLCFEVALCCLILYISLDITSFALERYTVGYYKSSNLDEYDWMNDMHISKMNQTWQENYSIKYESTASGIMDCNKYD